MIPHQCQCGQRISVGIQPDACGIDYHVEFRIHATNSGNSRTVNTCPRCKTDLYDALCNAQLHDITTTAIRRSA